jgi:hypothetical protein
MYSKNGTLSVYNSTVMSGEVGGEKGGEKGTFYISINVECPVCSTPVGLLREVAIAVVLIVPRPVVRRLALHAVDVVVIPACLVAAQESMNVRLRTN